MSMFSPPFKTGLGLLALRVAVAAILLAHGALKLLTGPTTWSPDLPAAVQAAVAWAEVLAGALLLLGLLTRPAAAVVIALQAGAIALFTGQKGLIAVGPFPPGSSTLTVHVGWEYNLALIAISVALLVLGGGVIALDAYAWRRRRPAPGGAAPQAEPALLRAAG
jgi:putative oxidoreductase